MYPLEREKLLYHTPLADAIMVGNIEIVRALIPLTNIAPTPKPRFGSYLHVAIKYGQFKIFKIIFKWLKNNNVDWIDLKDKKERCAYDLLLDETYRIGLYNHKLEKPVKIGMESENDLKKIFLEFLESNM